MSPNNPQINRETCYFCDDGHTDLLETHHLVSRRHGGSDNAHNLVEVCPTCHQKLEMLYDREFYTAIGASETEDIVEYIASSVAYELLTLRYDMSSRILETAEWMDDTWIDTADTESESTAKEWRQYRDDADHDVEEIASSVFDSILPNNQKIEIVDESDDDLEEFDADVVEAGTSKSQRDRIKNVKGLINEIEEEYQAGAPLQEIIVQAEEMGMTSSKTMKEIEKLKTKGEVYEPKRGHLRAT